MIGVVVIGVVVLITWGIWEFIDGDWVEREKAKERRRAVTREIQLREQDLEDKLNRLWDQLKHYY